jgi:hypothetical protein
MRHMELADILEYIDPGYVGDDQSAERSIEYALNLLDVINRAAGGSIATRYKLPGKSAQLRIGAPLSVREHQGDARAPARARAEELDHRLRDALERLSR